MANIFTIGYSAFDIDEFIDELQKNSIVCVVDVRSNPMSSEYYKDYNGYNLEKILKKGWYFKKNKVKSIKNVHSNKLL